MGMGTDLETFTQHEVHIYSLDFGVCNADQLSGLWATAQAGTATSLILDVSAPSSSSLTSCPTGHIWLLPALHCLRQIRTTSRDETTKGLLGSLYDHVLARRLLQSTPNSIRAHRMPPRSHAEAIYRLPNPTCRSGSPIDMLHALCPCPLPWSLPLPTELRSQLQACTLQMSPRISQSPHTSYPTLRPPGPYFPIPLQCFFSDSSFLVLQLLGVPETECFQVTTGFIWGPVADWR